jgi:hypothetical protein
MKYGCYTRSCNTSYTMFQIYIYMKVLCFFALFHSNINEMLQIFWLFYNSFSWSRVLQLLILCTIGWEWDLYFIYMCSIYVQMQVLIRDIIYLLRMCCCNGLSFVSFTQVYFFNGISLVVPQLKVRAKT